MKAKTLATLLLVLVAAPSFAHAAASRMLGEPVAKLVQLSAEERRALQERWERATPDERGRLRQEVQDRMRMPGFPDSSRFGTGFERRTEEGRDEARGGRDFFPDGRAPRDGQRH